MPRRIAARLESHHAPRSHLWMAGVRRLLHHPFVLADGASPRSSVASTRSLPVPRPDPGVVHYVARDRSSDGSLA